jgi:hypothetical protein
MTSAIDSPGRVTASESPSVPRSAVVWINGRFAIVARTADTGFTTCQIDRDLEPESIFLDRVVREIGDRERVVILGPGSARLALEREYVGVNHRPDHLVDVEPAAAITPAELVDRLREISASG